MIAPFPPTLAPPSPFPHVVTQTMSAEFVAPGVRRATYRLQTVDGPLVVNLVALDLHEPSLHLRAVIAHDRLISKGETISSMAHRIGAVAGVNADYFDIGQTNQPLNIVVQGGALVRTPSRRVALDVRADGSVHIDRFTFTGTVTYGTSVIPLTTVNEWPPQGGATFLNGAFGTLAPASGVLVAELVPQDVVHGPRVIAGAYRVAAIGPATSRPAGSDAPTAALAFGPAALALAPPPTVGEAVTVMAETQPALADVVEAVGGGPLLVRDGAATVDADAPAPEESTRRFPVSGAGTVAGDEVLLACVDGRQPTLSIGLTRPQFAALFLALGATDALAFDSGGSATLVARKLGDPTASDLGSPSDGVERAVADGLFAVSDAPVGPATRLVVRPPAFVALPHVALHLRADRVDDAGHALGSVSLPGGGTIVAGSHSSRVTVRAGKLQTSVPIDVVTTLSRLDVTADNPNPDPGSEIRLVAVGYDARGRTVDLGDAVRFEIDRGRSMPSTDALRAGRDRVRVGDNDFRVIARVGAVEGALLIRVGSHVVPIDGFAATQWLRLGDDPRGGAVMSFALAAPIELPGEPVRLRVEIDGDGSGVGARVLLANRFGEARSLSLAKSIDWNGPRLIEIALPNDLNPPVTLRAISLVAARSDEQTHNRSSIGFRAFAVVVRGSRL